MKIVSYNLHFGGKTGPGNQWEQMMADFAPDFVFAQESFDPQRYFSPDEFASFKGCIWAAVQGHKWGSAILSRCHQLEAVQLTEYEGWVIGARVHDLVIGGVPQSAMLFCIHAPSPGPYEPVVNRILDDIKKRWDGQPLIVAGDFNITTAIRHPKEALKNTRGELKILRRLRQELGLLNAWQVLHPNQDLPQTLRWNKDTLPSYHCDAVFLSQSHLSHLRDASIESSGVWGQLSDHNPAVVTIE